MIKKNKEKEKVEFICLLTSNAFIKKD